MFLQLLPLVDRVAIIELEFYDRGILVPSFVGVGYSIRRQEAMQAADPQSPPTPFRACVGINCTVAVRLYMPVVLL